MAPELLTVISDNLKEAMKAKDTLKVSVMRMVLSAAKNKEFELKRMLSDADMIGILSTQIKQRRESVESYIKGNRQDLADKEEAEIRILQVLLPAQLSGEEIRKIINDAIKKAGAQSVRDVGNVMGIVMPMVKGRADGKMINQIVKDQLSTL